MPSVSGQGESFGAAVRSVLSQVSLGRARPSYNRVSPAAQFRQLSRSAAGRRALDLAGVSPADRTAKRWLSRAQAPSKANREGIARAYEAARRGGIPAWVKQGTMHIDGRIATEGDSRDRTMNVDLSAVDNPSRAAAYTAREDGRSHWEAVEDLWADMDDDELAELVAEELVAESDVGPGSGDGWGFPGGAYTVSVSGR